MCTVILFLIISIQLHAILRLVSGYPSQQEQRLGELHERLGENTRQTECLLFQIHSIVFDKTEQILCFIEKVTKTTPQQSQQEQPLRDEAQESEYATLNLLYWIFIRRD